MTRQTPFLDIPFPSSLSEPWLDDFDSMLQTLDAELFSAVVDRNLLLTGGGVINFDTSTNTLSWTEPIKLTNFVTGFFMEVPAGSATMLDGQFLAAILSRGLEDVTGTINLMTFVDVKLLNRPRGEFHVDAVICFRFGDLIIFRNGRILPPDTPFPILTDPLLGLRTFILSEFLKSQYLNQTLIGTPNGVRTDFGICRNADRCLVAIYRDGMRMLPGIDYEELGCHRVRFVPAPATGVDFVLDMYEPQVLFQGVFEEANIWGEFPEGAIDGVNTIFTICLPHFLGTLRVWIDGVRMKLGTDYLVTSPTTFQFTFAPAAGQVVFVDYMVDRTGVSSFVGFFVFNEIPTQNTPVEFQTVNDFRPGTIAVYQDGMRMKLGTDYIEGPGSNKITMSFPVTIPPSQVVVDYMKL